MQFLVPKDITTEDRIIFGLSFKQVAILLGGLGSAYVSYLTVKSQIPYLNVFLATIFILIATLFAFVKIQDLSLAQFIIVIIQYLMKPEKRYFYMGVDRYYYLADNNMHKLTAQQKEKMEHKKRKHQIHKHLHDLAHHLDYGDEAVDEYAPKQPVDHVSDSDMIRISFGLIDDVIDTERKERLEKLVPSQDRVQKIQKQMKETSIIQDNEDESYQENQHGYNPEKLKQDMDDLQSILSNIYDSGDEDQIDETQEDADIPAEANDNDNEAPPDTPKKDPWSQSETFK